MHESFGFRLTGEAILNQASARRPPLPAGIRLTSGPTAPLFSYDPSQRAWDFVEAPPPGQ
jgi:hypothetical protein